MYKTSLKFRNLDVSPYDAVSKWTTEGLYTAIERGHINDWKHILKEYEKDKSFKDELQEALKIAIDDGKPQARLMLEIIS